jgi:pilus assembly protein Flp/PilA
MSMHVQAMRDALVSFVRTRFGLGDRGASLVEYAFLVALIAMVCLAAVRFFGDSTSMKYSSIVSTVDGSS